MLEIRFMWPSEERSLVLAWTGEGKRKRVCEEGLPGSSSRDPCPQQTRRTECLLVADLSIMGLANYRKRPLDATGRLECEPTDVVKVE